MENQQYETYQKIGNMQQSFGAGGSDQVNHNLDSAAPITELPKPGVGEKEEENNGVVNPEIPNEGDPTPEEKPIVF